MRIGNLFKRNERGPAFSPPGFDLDGTLYAVGDIHGMSTLMNGIVERIHADAVLESTQAPATLVFMGDYVDRGEDSRGVMEQLRRLDAEQAVETVILLGNHDTMMLGFADAPLKHRQWLEWGGLQTLASFGIRGPLPSADERTIERAGVEFADALGDLREFMQKRTVLEHRVGNVILTHAGMSPDAPVDEQDDQTLLWGSRRFLESGGPPGYWYVHGHTIVDQPQIVGNRIAIDTGAFGSGRLSAARITGEGCFFLGHTLEHM